MEINRKQVVEGFLQNLYRISNKEYQRRIWIEGSGPECHDFDEAVNDFFDDGDLILKKYREFNITEKQYQILIQFRDLFESFVDGDRSYLPEEFIDTPEWERIMNLAKEVLDAFNDQRN